MPALTAATAARQLLTSKPRVDRVHVDRTIQMASAGGVKGDVEREVVSEIALDAEGDLLHIRGLRSCRSAGRPEGRIASGKPDGEEVLVDEQGSWNCSDRNAAGWQGSSGSAAAGSWRCERALEGIGRVQIQRADRAGRGAGRAAGQDHQRHLVGVEAVRLRLEIAGRAIVEEAVVRPQDGLAVAAQIVSDAEARSEVRRCRRMPSRMP